MNERDSEEVLLGPPLAIAGAGGMLTAKGYALAERPTTIEAAAVV